MLHVRFASITETFYICIPYGVYDAQWQVVCGLGTHCHQMNTIYDQTSYKYLVRKSKVYNLTSVSTKQVVQRNICMDCLECPAYQLWYKSSKEPKQYMKVYGYSCVDLRNFWMMSMNISVRQHYVLDHPTGLASY